MEEDVEKLINMIIPNHEVKIIYVLEDKKINLEEYTDDDRILKEYGQLPNNNFFGLFILPGTKDFYTILINKKILNTNQFFNTLSHELFHCLFYKNNHHLLNETQSYLGYNTCDEMFARYKGLQIGYKKSLYNDFIFEENDISTIESTIYKRIIAKTTWYEFISLFAHLWFVKKDRNLDVDFGRAFKNANQSSLKALIQSFEQLDFGKLCILDISRIEKLIVAMF